MNGVIRNMDFQVDVIVTVFTEIARLFIIQKYCSLFFEDKSHKKMRYITFIISYILTTFVYLVFHNAIINILVTFSGIFIITMSYKGNIKKRLLFSILILAVSVVSDFLAACISINNPSCTNYDVLGPFLSVFLFFIIAVLIEKIIGKKKENIITAQWWYLILLAVVSICTLVVILYDNMESRVSDVFIGVTLLVLNMIVYYLYNTMTDKYISERENMYLRKQMEMYENQMRVNIDNARTVRSMRHDMKHHMLEILALAHAHKDDEIISYINSMKESISLPGNIVDTGNIQIDGVLNYMLTVAGEKGIAITKHIAIPEDVKLSTFDMNVVFGNLFDNAIEASEQIEKPEIIINVRYNQNCLFIDMTNKYNGKIKKVANKIISAKEDTKNHGIGLDNIKHIVSKYHGDCEIKYDEEWFKINIVLFIS